jgi:hypothetical protein
VRIGQGVRAVNLNRVDEISRVRVAQRLYDRQWVSEATTWPHAIIRPMSLRSSLYQLARFLGDINAIKRGPSALGRRLVRKEMYRGAGRFIARLVPPARGRR